MSTIVPALHGASFQPGKLPQSSELGSTPGTGSKVVPPPSARTKRDEIRAVLCEPGKKDWHQRAALAMPELTKQPFSGVQSSRAIQHPTALGGSVYKNVESL